MSNISVDYDVLNQKQTPAFYASSLATRPAFGYPGRIFIDTDSPSSGIYRDTGSAWVQVADPGAGTTGTLQQVTTNGNTTTQGISITAGGLSANTVSVIGGTSSQFLKANGTLDSATYALDSTVVHLAGTETITGLKTINSSIFTSAPQFNSGIFLKEGVFSSAGGFTGLMGNTDGIRVMLGNGVGYHYLHFPTSTANDYTYPATSGTLSLSTAALTAGSVVFVGSGGVLSQDNTNFFFDDTNNFLGIGNTGTPSAPLDIHNGTVGQLIQLNATSTNNSNIGFLNGGVGKWRIGNVYNAGANDFNVYNIGTTSNAISINSTTNNVTLNGTIVGTTATFTNSGSGIGVGITNSGSGDGLKITHSLGRALQIASSSTGYGIIINNDTASTSIPFTIQKSGSPVFTILDTGALSGTSASLSGALNINVASGTGINSTGDAIFRGNTGIGTPRQLLISSSGSTPVYLDVKGYGANYGTDLGLRTFDASGNSFNVFYGTSNGNAIIGGVTDAGYRLDVVGTGRFNGTLDVLVAAQTIASFNTSSASGGWINFKYNTTTSFGYIGTGNQISTGAAVTDFAFANNAGNIVFATGSFVERMRIASTGNVGIGTSSPTATLHVLGPIMSQDSRGGSFAAVEISGGSSSLNPYISVDQSNPLTFIVGAAERMRITSGGNVLIGTTTDSGYKLQITGTVYSSGTITSNSNIITNNSFQWPITSGGNFQMYPSGTTLYVYNSNVGNIGAFNGTTGVYTPLSNINKKKDFEQSYLGLNAILGLNPTLYRMKDEDNTNKHLGFIAQEVKEFIPQAFVESGDFIGLDYQAITSVLVKAIQELNEKLIKNNIN
jgi:hypothetical protein